MIPRWEPITSNTKTQAEMLSDAAAAIAYINKNDTKHNTTPDTKNTNTRVIPPAPPMPPAPKIRLVQFNWPPVVLHKY